MAEPPQPNLSPQRALNRREYPKPDKQDPPTRLGYWAVSMVQLQPDGDGGIVPADFNDPPVVTPPTDDWDDGIFDNFSLRRWEFFLPTRAGEFWYTMMRNAAQIGHEWANAYPLRASTVWKNNGPAYTANVLLQCSADTFNIGIKINGKFTNYTTNGTKEIPVQQGDNVLVLTVKTLTSTEKTSTIQFVGQPYHFDESEWRHGQQGRVVASVFKEGAPGGIIVGG